jgi:hypothetical protein
MEQTMEGWPLLEYIQSSQININEKSKAIQQLLFNKYPEIFDKKIFHEENMQWIWHILESSLIFVENKYIKLFLI